MTSHALRIRIFVGLLGLTALAVGGCPPTDESLPTAAAGASETLTTFVQDFARQLLAAWLL